MPIDFERLVERQGRAPLISPIDIFNALPAKDSLYEYLRDGQGRVLEGWHDRRAERDLVIKMNTGGGKTLVGLLILQACLNEGIGPALYVAPDNYLCGQVLNEARLLGIAATDDPDDHRYVSSSAVAVVNIHKLMNGMSVFGGPGNVRPSPIPIGSIIIDDVHAALATTDAQFTINLPRDHTLYQRLLSRFEPDLSNQAHGTLLDMRDGDAKAILRVPFWSWGRDGHSVTGLLQQARDDPALRFTWPLLRDVLPLCQAVFTSRSLEIKPPCPPVSFISSFEAAQRRIFLTATLADDSVLVDTFDTNPTSVSRPIVPLTASDLGDRMILAPQQINPSILTDDIRDALATLAEDYNVVVLVPSHRRSEYWRDVAAETVTSEEIVDAVGRLRLGHVGLVVFENKYDGIDLPDEACRILVIDGLPEVYGGIARREAELAANRSGLFDRQMQRIEQGMGRGVRSARDYCVVLLIGEHLIERIANPGLHAMFSSLTQAQFEISRSIAEQLSRAPLEELVSVMKQSLDRDPGWVTLSREAIAGLTYEEGHVSGSVIAQRNAFNAATVGQYQRAAEILSLAINEEENVRLQGQMQEQLAAYTNFFDEAHAQQVLAGALAKNPRVLRPIAGVSTSRIAAIADQAAVAARFMAQQHQDRNGLLITTNALLSDLRFDAEATNEFEDALERVASYLGFSGQRPERDFGNGPDVLWAIGNLEYLVIECKSGASSDVIYRSAVEQLAHSMNWFGEAYDNSCRAVPVLVHPSNELAPGAVAPQHTRVITSQGLQNLTQAVGGFIEAVAASGTWGDAVSVAEQLRHHSLGRTLIVTSYGIPTRSARN